MWADKRLSQIAFLELVVLIFADRDLLASDLNPKAVSSIAFDAVLICRARHIDVLRLDGTTDHLLLAPTKIFRKRTQGIQPNEREHRQRETKAKNYFQTKAGI